MKKTLALVPSGYNVGLTTVTLSVIQTLTDNNYKVGFYKPIIDNHNDPSIKTATKITGITPPQGITLTELEQFLAAGDEQILMETMVERFQSVADQVDIMIVEGLILNQSGYSKFFNNLMVRALDAEMLLVAVPQKNNGSNFKETLQIQVRHYQEQTGCDVVGCLLNKIGQEQNDQTSDDYRKIIEEINIPVIATIPWINNFDQTNLAQYLDQKWFADFTNKARERRMPPPVFRNFLIQSARKASKRIVLPEGTEPRTVEAAIICYQREIAKPVLLANPNKLKETLAQKQLTLPDGMEVIDPQSIAGNYVEALVEMRKHKGMTREKAIEQLQDEVMLGTMMLKQGDVDGLVSGAVHTTADTMRPALQLIKTDKESDLVSSIFFMCLPNQIMIYGDCAINPNPTAEELATIAIQAEKSARSFGIPPRVAMISYSTGSSGIGADVEKVRKATEIVKQKYPKMLIDGPLQYDAAVVPSVGKSKAPNSSVAGQATVIVFPDLNTGNTTYKAVQRSANAVSIGPMLQGLAKPVNDLSRGALVDDIVYTIALTAIQAAAIKE